jgi:hypothetical protein
MTRKFFSAALAIAFIAAIPLDAAFARGGGGGGGGFGGGGGGGGRGGNGGFGGARDQNDRGTLGYSRPQNTADQRLFDSARKDCSGARYSSGATPRIDYASQTYSCFEPGSSRR